MELRDPFIITARLMAGVKIGNGYISIGFGERNGEGRMHYGAFIDVPELGIEHEVTDFCSGIGGGDIQDGMENLLGFLYAAVESYEFEQSNPGEEGENTRLFPAEVLAWASGYSDEISMLECEIEESPECVRM